MVARASLQGEGGYYLTVFEAAIEYIRTVNLDSAHQADNKRGQRDAGAGATAGNAANATSPTSSNANASPASPSERDRFQKVGSTMNVADDKASS